MKELDSNELREINGGWVRILLIIVGGLAYELITEGFEQCYNDFVEGIESTNKD